MAIKNYYTILEIDSSATQDEIKIAYRKLVRQYHPDKNHGNQSFEDRFKLIREAYETLSEPKERDNYDAKLAYDTYISNPSELSRFLKGQINKPKKYKTERKKSTTTSRKRTVIINSGGALLVAIVAIVATVNVIKFKSDKPETNSVQTKIAYDGYQHEDAPNVLTIQYIRKAKGYVSEHNTKLAFIYFDKAIDISPNNPDIYFNRGLAYYLMQKHDLSLQDFNKTIELNPSYKNAYWLRAKLKYDLDDNEGSIKDFSSAITLDSKNDSLYFNRGLAYFYLGQYEEAVADIDMAIKINPNQPQYYFDRGDAKEMSGELEGCSDWKKAKELGYTTSAYKMKECITPN